MDSTALARRDAERHPGQPGGLVLLWFAFQSRAGKNGGTEIRSGNGSNPGPILATLRYSQMIDRTNVS